MRIYVDAYSGYKANERPRQFCLDDEVHQIAEIENRWRQPDAENFKVRTTEGERYVLHYDEQGDTWTLQNGFNGDELLAQPDTELITVEPKVIREGESRIADRERCRPDKADHPFASILDELFEPQAGALALF